MGWDENSRPRLRQIEPVQLILEGRPVIGFKDPLQLLDRMLCVRQEVVPVVAMMDGKHTLRDVQTELSRNSGSIVFMDDIKALVEQLEDACLLEGERFQDAFARKAEEYRQKPFRQAAHAGLCYSEDPEGLGKQLEALFIADDGPGLPELASDLRRPVGLIAPHIDIRAGGGCFARAYHALASGQPSDVYVILGTGHAGVRGLFAATGLDFQTPLGTVETDRELLGALSRELGRDPAAEEILHATEHVIEFQLIFLQYLFGGRRRFTILPVLCSLSYHLFNNDADYSEQKQLFREFCAALKKVCQGSGKTVCFIASADLDHIGPRYGDDSVPHQGTVSQTLEQDGKLLHALERLDVNKFIQSVAREKDARRICGFPPITTMFHCMEASEGYLLSLDHATVDSMNSFVSFSSMIFY
jgi:MEMO1 family protein